MSVHVLVHVLVLVLGQEWIDRPPGIVAPTSPHAPARWMPEGYDESATLDGLEAGPARAPRPLSVGAGGFGWTIFWSIAVIALLGATLWILRRYVARARLGGGGGVVTVLARTSLDAHSRLFVVELGETVFLVGGTRDRLTPLGTIRDPQEVAAVRRRATGREQAAFTSALGEELKSAERGEGIQKIREQIGELKATVKRWGGAEA